MTAAAVPTGRHRTWSFALGQVLLWSALIVGVLLLLFEAIYAGMSVRAISGGVDPVVGSLLWLGLLVVPVVLTLFLVGVFLTRGLERSGIIAGAVGVMLSAVAVPAGVALMFAGL